MLSRREFVASGAAFAASGVRAMAAEGIGDDYEAVQREIDGVRAADFTAYQQAFEPSQLRKFPALQRLEDAFDRILREVRETVVTDKPAVWLLYNMGIVVKTPETCLAVDISHRRAPDLAPLLDFALITHNHSDHFTEPYYAALNGAGKTVITNFKDNYGARHGGGYTRSVKTFAIKDVTVKTGLTDHNGYLVDFTSTFEIASHGYMIYHTGDCSNVEKLNPTVTPDLWIVHPYCGLKTVDGVKKFHPKKTVIAHLNELGHEMNRWRWTWAQGLEAKAQAEAVGGTAVVPIWGTRLV